MDDSTTRSLKLPVETVQTPQVLPRDARDVLDQVLREGARRMLQQAVEAEVQQYIQDHAQVRDEHGHRLVVRNGHLPERNLQTGVGTLPVRQPRVNDKRTDEEGNRIRFTSSILPRYLRRTRSIDELIPWLYLKGVSTGDFAEALAALLGQKPEDVSNLSPNVIQRLKEVWRQEWDHWSRRSLEATQYVYFWADGVHFNVRLEEAENKRLCVLVIIGATAEGKKELVAVMDGYRESQESWLEVLRDLKKRGLEVGPKLATGDGALGFWAALRQVYPQTREQRCWVHKEANVLNKLPKSQQPAAKKKLHEIWMAATRQEAYVAFEVFVTDYQQKYPKAAECLAKDREQLLAFYDFPAEHWQHLRTTNPLESTFSTVRLRTDKTKGSGTRQACLTMVFKLCQSAQRNWRTLNGSKELPREVFEGIVFENGIRKAAA